MSCQHLTKRKPNHDNYTSTSIQSIRSSTLKNLAMLYDLYKKKYQNPILPIVNVDWIIKELGCSQRTAYDYKATLEVIIGIR